MANINTVDNAGLIRNEMWNDELLSNFSEESFLISNYVDWLTDVEGGSTNINIVGVGELAITEYTEGETIPTTGIADRLYTFKPDKDFAAGVSYTDKMARDSHYFAKTLAYVPVEYTRVAYVTVEEYFMALTKTLPLNVNGVEHRLAGSGTGGKLSTSDFSKGKAIIYKDAKCYSNYIALINSDQASTIEQSIQITTQSNAKFEEVAVKGLIDATGVKFEFNIYGVDVYVSNLLPKGVDTTADGGRDGSVLDAVVMFSATDRKLPFIGAWVEKPSFEVERDASKGTTNHYFTMSMGGGLIYPENLVVIECTPEV